MTDPISLLLVSNSTQHGQGYLEHCESAVRSFFDGRRRIAFVPWALADHDAYAEKAKARFAELGLGLVSVHEGDPTAIATAADGVFIGGGNTFRLLKTLYETRLFETLRAKVTNGTPYMGTSAGANVATASICTTNDMPIVQPPSFQALGFVPFQINPHYLDPDPRSTHMGETRETRIREYHEEAHNAVVGLREGAWLHRHGEQLTLGGTTGARVFQRGRSPLEFQIGADLGFLLTDGIFATA